MPGELILMIVLIVLLILALGLPLLFRPDSVVPDMLGFGFLALVILYFAWSSGDWWMLLPCAAFVALVVRIDRARPDPPLRIPSPDRYGMSEPTWTRFQLWRWANRVVLLLALGSIILLLTDTPRIPFGIILDLLLIAILASNLFRFSFYRSARCDANAVGAEPAPASPAASG